MSGPRRAACKQAVGTISLGLRPRPLTDGKKWLADASRGLAAAAGAAAAGGTYEVVEEPALVGRVAVEPF